MQMREKVGKSRNTLFFQCFVAPEGRKVGSLKRRVRSQLARREMKNCTPLWREAHFQVKMCKTHQLRIIFTSWDVEKVHAVAARSTFRSQNAQSTPAPDHFWKLRCRKSARRCGAKHILKSKCTKHTRSGPLLEVEMSKKRTPLWREAHFEVNMLKHVQYTGGSDHFWTFRCVSRGRCNGLCTFSEVSKTWGFRSISKNEGRRGTFEEDLQRCISRGGRSTKDMFIRDVRMSGRWFPQRGCILEHQICRFAKMILRDRCSTSYDLASIFRGRRSTLDRWSGKIAKRIGTRPSALHLTFHFWRKSRRIVSFLTLLTSKVEEVSQDSFVFDVVKFEKWRILAELFRFWRCQTQKLRRSRRIASFLMLSTLKNEEVSQNWFVFDVVKFKHWESFAELFRFWCFQVQNLRTSCRIASFSSLQIDR